MNQKPHEFDSRFGSTPEPTAAEIDRRLGWVEAGELLPGIDQDKFQIGGEIAMKLLARITDAKDLKSMGAMAMVIDYVLGGRNFSDKNLTELAVRAEVSNQALHRRLMKIRDEFKLTVPGSKSEASRRSYRLREAKKRGEA